MIPKFRRGILGWKYDGSPSETAQLVLELQRIFAYLQESNKQYYDPTGNENSKKILYIKITKK